MRNDKMRETKPQGKLGRRTWVMMGTMLLSFGILFLCVHVDLISAQTQVVDQIGRDARVDEVLLTPDLQEQSVLTEPSEVQKRWLDDLAESFKSILNNPNETALPKFQSSTSTALEQGMNVSLIAGSGLGQGMDAPAGTGDWVIPGIATAQAAELFQVGDPMLVPGPSNGAVCAPGSDNSGGSFSAPPLPMAGESPEELVHAKPGKM